MNEQLGIALFGVTAILLTQDPRPSRRRYACLFGLLGQPFWIYAAWKSQQWGTGLVSALYAAAWMRGVWHEWLHPRR